MYSFLLIIFCSIFLKYSIFGFIVISLYSSIPIFVKGYIGTDIFSILDGYSINAI